MSNPATVTEEEVALLSSKIDMLSDAVIEFMENRNPGYHARPERRDAAPPPANSYAEAAAPTTESKLLTFAAFEGKIEGDKIKGVSIIQEGPALGHGVWVDGTTLSQVKKLAEAESRLKSKLNHWSGVQDAVGYYTNFRIQSGKLLADLTLFSAHPGKDHLLQMIDEIPGSFGVSIMFQPGEPEYDKDNDRYNTRLKRLFSADFVDTPAANRDGVFAGLATGPGSGSGSGSGGEQAFSIRSAPAAVLGIAWEIGAPYHSRIEKVIAKMRQEKKTGAIVEFQVKRPGHTTIFIITSMRPFVAEVIGVNLRTLAITIADELVDQIPIKVAIDQARTAALGRNYEEADRMIRELGSPDGFDIVVRNPDGTPR